LGISADCTGSRETVETADESLRLPGYAVLNLMAGIHREIAGVDLALFFQVDNIMDKSYEVIRAYPHPGRTLHFTFTMGFGKENSQN
jgi:outer membrane cobalamin receptor